MKILSTTYNYNISNKQKRNIKSSPTISKKKITAATTSIAALGVVAGSITYLHNKNNYINKLAIDLSKELNKKITSKDLKSVVSREELIKLFASLKEENFIASPENIKNGIYIADLHSHTIFSDGTIAVKDFLNQAAEYGNKLNKINGKKFIVAISDHDGIEGAKEALKIIAQEPDKYKNIKFVPASEVSFVMPCSEASERHKRFNSSVEMPEMLVYGINPFSKETNKFFQEIYRKRKEQAEIAINEAKKIYSNINYSIKEYAQIFNPHNKFCFLNQHWKIWNYLHTKTRVANIAKEQNENAEALYSRIATQVRDLTPYSLNQYLEKNNSPNKSKMLDARISDFLHKEIFPNKLDDINVHSNYEINFKDIVNFAKKENALIGFAHPGFTMQNFTEPEMRNKLQYYINNSEGTLKFIEKYHQAYPVGKEISLEELKQYNILIDELDLIQIGGHDNHSKFLLPTF